MLLIINYHVKWQTHGSGMEETLVIFLLKIMKFQLLSDWLVLNFELKHNTGAAWPYLLVFEL